MPYRIHRHILGGAASLLVVLAAACGPTRTSVTQLWQAPAPRAEMRSIIVFGTGTDDATRRVVEDRFARDLGKHGVKAVPAYKVFPGKQPEPSKARELVKELGFDGILVAKLESVRESQAFVPSAYDGGFWNSYYNPGWSYDTPGYLVTDETVKFRTTLWDTRAQDKLVWAAETTTKNPSTDSNFATSLTDAVVPALEKSKLIPAD